MLLGWPLSIAWHLLPFQIDAIDSIRSILCEHVFKFVFLTEIAESVHSTFAKWLRTRKNHYRQWFNGSCSLLRNQTNVFAFTMCFARAHTQTYALGKNVWLIEINYNFESEKIIGKKLKLCLICACTEHIYNIHYKLVRVFAQRFYLCAFNIQINSLCFCVPFNGSHISTTHPINYNYVPRIRNERERKRRWNWNNMAELW